MSAELLANGLREINRSQEFVVADLIREMSSSPNVNAVVLGKDHTEVICISDQVLRGNVYLGNIYPLKENKRIKDIITDTTKVIGDHISTLGFRGLFGLDFIVTPEGKVFTVDLNPRRQGGYLCNVLMSKKIDIIELELALAIGAEKIPLVKNAGASVLATSCSYCKTNFLDIMENENSPIEVSDITELVAEAMGI